MFVFIIQIINSSTIEINDKISLRKERISYRTTAVGFNFPDLIVSLKDKVDVFLSDRMLITLPSKTHG